MSKRLFTLLSLLVVAAMLLAACAPAATPTEAYRHLQLPKTGACSYRSTGTCSYRTASLPNHRSSLRVHGRNRLRGYPWVSPSTSLYLLVVAGPNETWASTQQWH
jgi:hypothetical protein